MKNSERSAPRLEFKTLAFEIKSKGDNADGSELCGTGAIFFNIDKTGDIFAPGCFEAELPFFRSEGIIRDEHRVTTGRITQASETKLGLAFEGVISKTAAGLDQMILVRDGVIRRSSIGSVNSGTWLEGPDEVKSWWDSVGYVPSETDLVRSAYGARLITRSKPYEISTTWIPTNELTTIQAKGGQPARPTFADHSQTTLDLVEEFLSRAEGLKGLRAKDGRGLTHKSLATIRRLRDRLEELAATSPPETPGPVEDDQAAHDRFLALGERLRGATQ